MSEEKVAPYASETKQQPTGFVQQSRRVIDEETVWVSHIDNGPKFDDTSRFTSPKEHASRDTAIDSVSAELTKMGVEWQTVVITFRGAKA